MILVTGATGFVGKAVCRTLRDTGHNVVGAVRSMAGAGEVNVGDIGPHTDWRGALDGCDTVIHLAARVHVMHDKDGDPVRAYRWVNVDATRRLAELAVLAGVRRFVFVSSIKVNGEQTLLTPFYASDEPNPLDPYGQSKLEAECALREIGRNSGMEVVIIRPPLVYGPGVKANFRNLMKLVKLGVPLPFGRANNLRSMVALDNLVDLLITCAKHPGAPGGLYLASDGADLSVAELVRIMAEAMGKRPLLVNVPPRLIMHTAGLIGKSAAANRLFGSLQVDIANTRDSLAWNPVITPHLAIKLAVADFLMNNSHGMQ